MDSVWDSVRNSVGASVRNSVGDSGYGQHDAEWLSFYDYLKIACGLKKETEKLEGLWLIAQSANWFLPHQEICWVSERHNILHLNKLGRLHCENGIALAYPDGWGIYALNGVRMKSEYVLTPAHQLSIETILAETNVDIRRELIRKVGVERLKSKSKLVERIGDYELLDMSAVFLNIPYAPFLWMKNPSVEDTFHLEGVAPECHSVEQAINWRAGNIKKLWSPAELS